MTTKNNIPVGYKASAVGVIPQEWEVRTFQELGSMLGTNTLSRDKMNECSGCAQNIHYGDVLVKYGEVLDCTSMNIPWVNSDCRNANLGTNLQNGDIVISDTAEDYTVGKATEVQGVGTKIVLSGLHTIAFRPNVGMFASNFLGYYFNSTIYRSQLYPLIQGIKVCSISKKAISNTKLAVPPMAEQRKIAEILGVWDEAIEKQSRQIEKLELRKRALMQHLLTGRTRLPGFTTPWQKVKLGEICNITTGKLDANAMNIYGIYPFFTCAKEVSKINQFAFDTEALLISGNGEHLGYVHYYKGKFNAYQRTYVLNNFTQNIFYMFYTLKQNLPKRILQTKSSSNTPYIIMETLTNMEIALPNNQEQKAIAEVLTTADDEIAIHSKTLDALRLQKRGLMQQLLTGKTRVKFKIL